MNDQEILKSFNSLNIMVFILLSILSVAVLQKNVTVHFLVKVPTVNKKQQRHDICLETISFVIIMIF